MKNILKKTTIHILLAGSVFVGLGFVYAALPEVNSEDSLTATAWNNVVGAINNFSFDNGYINTSKGVKIETGDLAQTGLYVQSNFAPAMRVESLNSGYGGNLFEIYSARNTTASNASIFSAGSAYVPNALVLNHDGKVGIGTVSPGSDIIPLGTNTAKLDVTDDIIVGPTSGGGGQVFFRRPAGGALNGYIGFNETLNNMEMVNYSGGGYADIYAGAAGHPTAGGVRIGDGTRNIHVVIKGNGNVGIGTELPTQKLDIHGNIALGGKTLFTGVYHFSDSINYGDGTWHDLSVDLPMGSYFCEIFFTSGGAVNGGGYLWNYRGAFPMTFNSATNGSSTHSIPVAGSTHHSGSRTVELQFKEVTGHIPGKVQLKVSNDTNTSAVNIYTKCARFF